MAENLRFQANFVVTSTISSSHHVTNEVSTHTTSTLNGITKWAGPGGSAYDAASASMGEEVSARPRAAPRSSCDAFVLPHGRQTYTLF